MKHCMVRWMDGCLNLWLVEIMVVHLYGIDIWMLLLGSFGWYTGVSGSPPPLPFWYGDGWLRFPNHSIGHHDRY